MLMIGFSVGLCNDTHCDLISVLNLLH